MYTVKELLYDIRTLLDEYNEDGVVLVDSEVATLETNGLRIINMTLQEIFRNTKTFKEKIISNDRIKNMLGDLSQFNKIQFTGEDTYYPDVNGIVGAKAYFFTVDSDATVLIQEYNGTAWNTLVTETIVTDEEVDYKGQIVATNANYPIRMVFSGTTFYRHSNRCLYEYLFKTIPDYRPWVRYTMPDDFGELEKVVREYPQRQYDTNTPFKWEGHNDLVVNLFCTETLTVIYKAIPPKLTATTDEVPVINPTALEFIKYATAAKLAVNENPDVVSFFEQKANELKFEALREQPASEEKITDVYFGGAY